MTGLLLRCCTWRTRFLVGGNTPPVAAFTSNCTGLSCTFNGSGSSDAEGPIAGYAWNFGDGATGSGAQPAHTYAAAGTYTVALTVTDAAGATNVITHPVTVSSSTTGISFRGANGFVGNATTPALTVPSTVQAGDVLVLFATLNLTTYVGHRAIRGHRMDRRSELRGGVATDDGVDEGRVR